MERLKELREARGITTRALAAEFNITGPTLSNYENGKRRPDIDMLQRIADYFGVTTDYLLERSEEPDAKSVRPEPDPQMAFGASMANGGNYDDLSPAGKALMEEYYQYLRTKYPKER